MNQYIKNPKILLLKCSIEYLYREETKFTCIDPIVLQVSKSLKRFLAWFAVALSLVLWIRKKRVFISPSGTRVSEELCATYCRRPSKLGVGGKDSVAYCSGHAARARHHSCHQCQTGQCCMSDPKCLSQKWLDFFSVPEDVHSFIHLLHKPNCLLPLVEYHKQCINLDLWIPEDMSLHS